MGLFEAANILDVTPQTVKEWIRKGLLSGEKHTTPGGKVTWVLNSKEVAAFWKQA